MPQLQTAQSWLEQSTLLLKARPNTTRITTKYTLKTLPSTTSEPAKETTREPPPRATLTLKTYDPVSGTTLKYSTTKGQEVSRLVQILGRLAGRMSGVEEKEEVDVKTEVVEAVSKVVEGVKEAVGAGGGGKGKKKKGKK